MSVASVFTLIKAVALPLQIGHGFVALRILRCTLASARSTLGLAPGAAGDLLGETAPPHADHGSPASGARLRGRERPGNKIILLIETGSADVRDAAADCSPPSVTVAQPEAIDRLDVGKPPFAHLAAHPRRIMKVTFRHKQNPRVADVRIYRCNSLKEGAGLSRRRESRRCLGYLDHAFPGDPPVKKRAADRYRDALGVFNGFWAGSLTPGKLVGGRW